MTIALYIGAAYLTYYTMMTARHEWRIGNKIAGLGILLLSGCYLPIAVYLQLRH